MNMRTYSKLMLLIMLTISSTFVKAQNIEKEKVDIEKVITFYLAVTDYKDSTAIEKAFHPEAKLKTVNSRGELKMLSQKEWWDRVSRIDKPKVRKSTITILDISGVSAVVKVQFETSCDYHLLLKFNSGWKIVSKTLSVPL
jgi:hypothetical protein